MNWKKAIVSGGLLWVLMFVIVSAFIGFKIYEMVLTQLIIALIAGLISYILAGKLKPSKTGIALGYGLIFIATGLILDILVTMRFNSAIFSQWTLWLGYALVLLAPLLKVKKTQTV